MSTHYLFNYNKDTCMSTHYLFNYNKDTRDWKSYSFNECFLWCVRLIILSNKNVLTCINIIFGHFSSIVHLIRAILREHVVINILINTSVGLKKRKNSKGHL